MFVAHKYHNEHIVNGSMRLATIVLFTFRSKNSTPTSTRFMIQSYQNLDSSTMAMNKSNFTFIEDCCKKLLMLLGFR